MTFHNTKMCLRYEPIGPKWKHWLGLGVYVTTDECWCLTGFRPKRKLVNSHGSILYPSGMLVIPKGVRFSPTGPVPDLPSMVAASLFHDELYLFGREKLLAKGWRWKADKLLAKHMWNYSVPGKVYAPIAWTGVRSLYWPFRGVEWLYNTVRESIP